MFRTRPFALLCLCATAAAQTQPAAAPAVEVAFAIPGLFGPDGLTLQAQSPGAFRQRFQANFGPFNGLGSELTSLYTALACLGIHIHIRSHWGPTRGRRVTARFWRARNHRQGRVFAGFGFQPLPFSTLDGVDLRNFASVFQHTQSTPDPNIEDIITTNTFVDTQIDQSPRSSLMD